MIYDTRPMRDRSTVPPGLRNLAPEQPKEEPKKRPGPKPAPKVIRPRKERQVPECGNYKAFSRHKRRGEQVDDACLEAGRAYHRDYQRNRKKAAELKRLLEAGVNSETAQVLAERVR